MPIAVAVVTTTVVAVATIVATIVRTAVVAADDNRRRRINHRRRINDRRRRRDINRRGRCGIHRIGRHSNADTHGNMRLCGARDPDSERCDNHQRDDLFHFLFSSPLFSTRD